MSTARDAVGELGRPRVHLRLTDSTNERARDLALAGAPHGMLVTAAEQSAGRGRQGRRWSAPAGSSILMSLVLRPAPRLLPLMAAVAVCDVAGGEAAIKWPNDVVVPLAGAPAPGLGKLAGILVEARPQEGWAVLGIGLNVAVRLEDLPPELRPGAGGREAPSVAPGAEGGAPAEAPRGLPAASMGLARDEVEAVLARLLDALGRRLGEDAGTALAAWRERDALEGRTVAWSGGRGRAEGIDGDGRLVVAVDGGGHTTVGAGEIHIERIG
jgi:BirA family transcriptional regulator, biotin operon repressor / biotin---[acetyl-CoA-carboxylase] ligase